MAQVKKLQNGGNPSKYITIDQVKWYDTPENRKAWELLASQGDGAAQDILATLNDASYDNTASVTRQGDRVEFHNMKLTGLDTRGEKQLTKGSNFWRDTFGNKTKNSAVDRWLKFNSGMPVQNDDRVKDDDLIDISTGSRRFSYDKNGNYDQYLQSNANFLKTLDQITDYFTLGREVGDKKYKFSGEGLDMDAMWSIYNNPNSPIDLADFRRRILAGDVDDSDPVYRFLDPFFQGKGSAVTEDGQQIIADRKQADAWKEWSDKGFGDTADTKNFVYDSNSGEWVLNPNVLTSLGLTANSGAWFNDNFIRNHYGYDFLRDKVLLNGNWYTTADLTNPNSEAYKYLNSAQNDYYNKNRRGETDAADAVMMTSWGDKYENVYNPEMIGELYNNPYLRILKTNLATDNTLYNGIKLDPSYQLIQHINLRDQDTNGLGQRPIRYMIYDKYGNPVNLEDPSFIGPVAPYDINKFTNLYDYTTSTADQQLFNPYARISQDKDSPYYEAYALSPITDSEGKELIKAWRVPNRGTHVSIDPSYGGMNGYAFRFMPDNIYELLTNNNFLNSVLSNRPLADMFMQLINGTGNINNSIDALSTYFGEEKAKQFVDYFLKSKRDDNYRIAIPQVRKQGGIVKKQLGGRFEHVGFTNNKLPDKVNKLAQKAISPQQSKEIESWDDVWNNLSSNDKLELGAIITDLASSVAGYTGVGDVAAIAGGFGSNVARGIVDYRRDGLGTAAKNFLGRTALDVAALVPIVGDTANVGSAIKSMTTFLKNNEKVVRGLSASFMAAGLLPAVNSLNKITSGEKLTMDDIQSFATGLSSLTGLSLRGIRRMQDSRLASKIQNIQKPTYEAIVGDKKATLSQSDVNDLVRTSGDKNISEKLKALVKKNNSDLSDDEIAKLTPESFGLTQNRRKWLKDNVEKPKIEKEKGAFQYFLPGSGLRDDLKTNVNNIKPEHLGSAANRLMRQYGLSSKLGENYRMDRTSRFLQPYPRAKAVKRKIYSPVQDSPSTVVINDIDRDDVVPIYTIVDAPIVNANLPIPIGKINTRPSEITFKRQSPSIFTAEPRTVNDIRPLQQRPAKWRRLNAPQQQNNVEIVVGPDGVAKIGNRSQRFLNESQDLMQYYLKYRQYQQALNNVNSEKSFKRLLNNMQNDVTLKLMLEDQPGLLRNEFTAAKQRIGLTKRTIGDIDLKFKQGGILKGRRGLNDLSSVPMPKSVAEKQPFSNEQVAKMQQDMLNKAFANKDQILTKSTETITGGGRNNQHDVDWNKLGIKSIGLANLLRTFGEQRKFRSLNERDEQSLLQTQGSTPPKPTFRFQNPISAQYNADLANLFLQTKYQNQQTSDAKIQAANNAHANKLAMDHLNNMRQQESAAWSDYLNKQEANHNQWQQAAWQNDLRNAQIRNAANSIVTNGERNLLSQESAILNNAAYAAQNDLFKQGRINNLLTQQKNQLDLLISDAISNGKDPSGYQKLRKQIDSPEYISNVLRNSYYAKKGGKLRSTSDQMLIDNQKQVAKAIEKLNDNTMKLILKALS